MAIPFAPDDAARVSVEADPNCIEGWASRLYLPITFEGPSVVPSPKATAGTLVAWALGQVGQLNVLLHTIGVADGFAASPPPSELAGAIRHQLEQVESVLIAATEKLSE